MAFNPRPSWTWGRALGEVGCQGSRVRLGDHLDHPFQLTDRRRRPNLKEGLTQDHTVWSFSNAVTNYHQFSGFKKIKFTVLPFYRSEVWYGSFQKKRHQ